MGHLSTDKHEVEERKSTTAVTPTPSPRTFHKIPEALSKVKISALNKRRSQGCLFKAGCRLGVVAGRGWGVSRLT